jgi:hypothetical protein
MELELIESINVSKHLADLLNTESLVINGNFKAETERTDRILKKIIWFNIKCIPRRKLLLHKADSCSDAKEISRL